jgi:hypothetical protein
VGLPERFKRAGLRVAHAVRACHAMTCRLLRPARHGVVDQGREAAAEMASVADDSAMRRSVWWWVAGAAFVVAVGAALVYFAYLPDEMLARADQLGSVGSLITGIAALLITIVSMRVAGTPQTRHPSRTSTGLPRVWNVPVRNRMFLGRSALLNALREGLQTGGTAVVQALHGMGGVGKTQLAIEYAHRFAAEYDLVWWFASEKPELIGDQYLTLAIEADLVNLDADVSMALGKVQGHFKVS